MAQIAHSLTWSTLNETIKGIFGTEPSAKTLVWKTAGDAKVCDICFDGDGSTYTEDDPMLPNLPDDTHSLCRCWFEIQGEVPAD